MALKITTTGDKFAAEVLFKEARNYMSQLKASMVKASNPHLNLAQCQLQKRPYTGVVINCRSYFGNDEINIYVEPGGWFAKKLKEHFRILEEYFWYAFNASTVLVDDLYLKIFGYTDLNDLITDAQGNVYVIGGAPTDQTVSSGEPAIIAWDRNGQFLWRKMVYGSSGFDAGTGIDIDRNTGDMYFSYDQYNAARIQNYDGCLGKYNALGEIQWQKILQPTGGLDVTIFTRDAVAIPSTDLMHPEDNSSAVCGRFYSYTDESYLAFISKFNADGSLDWTKSFGDYDPVLGASGNEVPQIEDLTYSRFDDTLIAAGFQWGVVGEGSTLFPTALIMKFSTDGTLVWKKQYHSQGMDRDGTLAYYGDGMRVFDTAVDGEGNVYAIAFTQFIPVNLATIPIDYAHVNIFKLSPTGVTLWQRTVEYPTFENYDFQNPLPFSTSIAVSGGSVFVAFTTNDVANGVTDMALARLSKTDGAPIWKKKVTVPAIVVAESTIQGFFPKAITVERNCLYICGSISSSTPMGQHNGTFHVAMKLPTSGISDGRHRDLQVSNSDLIFYDDIANVPYRLPPSDDDNGFTEHYFTDEYSNPIVTIGTLALSISTVSTGHRGTPDWNITNKILRKQSKEKIY